MEKTSKGNTEKHRAKRVFLTNLALFTSLMLTVILLTTDDDAAQGSAIEGSEAETEASKEFSYTEEANILGQIDASNEHPDSLPDLDGIWPLRLARKRIRAEIAFENLSSEKKEELSQSYLKGYLQRYNDYYDGSRAERAGYELGLRYNPEIFGYVNDPYNNDLSSCRDGISIHFNITDEVSWRLFRQHLEHGYARSCNLIVPGKTITSIRQKMNTLQFLKGF